MKRRVYIKKLNRRRRKLLKELKRSEYSVDKTFLTYEDYSYAKEFSWSDIWFVGKYKNLNTTFSATIVSSYDEYDHAIEKMVEDEILKHYPNYYSNTELVFTEIEEGHSIDFIVHDKELEENIKKKREELNLEYRNKEIEIDCRISCDPTYHECIGLYIVVPEKFLTKEIVKEYVLKIQQMNLQDYTSLGKVNVRKEQVEKINARLIKNLD